MRRDWRRAETRTVRPFQGVDASLDGVRFRVLPEQAWEERLSFDACELSDIHPEFLLDLDRSALASADVVNASDLCLVIRLADIRLRRGEVVFKSAATELPPTWTVPNDIQGKFAWRFGVKATVALVLPEGRPPRPGEPFLQGHWVARKDFSVRPKASPRSFPIERWTADEFAECELPRDTAYWIDFISDDLNQVFEDPSDAFRLCLRADVYDALSMVNDTDRGRGVMSLLLADVLAETIYRGLRDVNPADIERDGLLDLALRKVTRATGASVEKLRRSVASGDFATMRAFVQATTEAKRHIAKVARSQ